MNCTKMLQKLTKCYTFTQFLRVLFRNYFFLFYFFFRSCYYETG